MKTPLVLDKLDSQGDYFIEKIKAALHQKIRKRYHGSIVQQIAFFFTTRAKIFVFRTSLNCFVAVS